MKRIVLAGLLIFLAAVVFAQTGVIRELSGTVELKSAGSAAFVPAKNGDTVARDTIVSTGFKSTALLQVGSTIITVRPLTRLSVSEISASAGNETLNMNLQAGRVRVDVNPPAGAKTSMAVVSPSATASVRGTSFEFDTRNLHVSNGIVLFKGNRGYTYQLSAGTSGSVGWTGTATSLVSTLPQSSPVGYDGGAGVTGSPGPSSGPAAGPGTPTPSPGEPDSPGSGYGRPPSNPGGQKPGGQNPGGENPGGGDVGLEY